MFEPTHRFWENLPGSMMKIIECTWPANPMPGFDFSRLSKSKELVDISPNTIRKFGREGLPLYRYGKAVFFSRSELAAFIRSRAQAQ